jgi:hypothetical protein
VPRAVLSEVYVVISFDKAGRVTDLELLDAMPQWDWVSEGQQVRLGNINGGDSTVVEMPARTTCRFCFGDHDVVDCPNIDDEQLQTELARRVRESILTAIVAAIEADKQENQPLRMWDGMMRAIRVVEAMRLKEVD